MSGTRARISLRLSSRGRASGLSPGPPKETHTPAILAPTTLTYSALDQVARSMIHKFDKYLTEQCGDLGPQALEILKGVEVRCAEKHIPAFILREDIGKRMMDIKSQTEPGLQGSRLRYATDFIREAFNNPNQVMVIEEKGYIYLRGNLNFGEPTSRRRSTIVHAQPANNVSVDEETSANETPREETLANETFGEHTLAQQTPTQEIPAEATPGKETPAEEMSEEEMMLVDNRPMEEIMFMDNMPAKETPVDNMLVDSGPADNLPLSHMPKDDVPVNRIPAKRKVTISEAWAIKKKQMRKGHST